MSTEYDAAPSPAQIAGSGPYRYPQRDARWVASERTGDVVLVSGWRDWYHFKHQQACFASGTAFEAYVTRVLELFHHDFVNPAPTGTFGDGGCDGLATRGTIMYAVYGQRPGRNAEDELARKVTNDFQRGFAEWDSFTEWRFVTNAPFGPKALKALTEIQRQHGEQSERVIDAVYWHPQRLWDEILAKVSSETLNSLFPGAPGIAHIELGDIVPLLDSLEHRDGKGISDGAVGPVPMTKMDYNALPAVTRIEFNEGRIAAARIDEWYASQEPDARDRHGRRFRELYEEARAVDRSPGAIVERLYVGLAGADMRLDSTRANAAFAVVAYFFDSCHIFEVPPAGWTHETESAGSVSSN